MPLRLLSLGRTQAYAGRERRRRRIDAKALLAAAMVLAGIVFATLCPLQLRPRLGDPDLERFGAYLLLGLCASLAAPRRPALVIFVVAAVAAALEAAQLLVPHRDAVFSDACVKAMGGVCGVFCAQASFALRRRLMDLLQDRRPGPRNLQTS